MSYKEIMDDESSNALLELFKILGPNTATVINGIYSTPWTAIPFTIAVLGVAEVKFPGLTNKFWGILVQFFTMIEVTLGNALADLGTGVKTTVSDRLKANGYNPNPQPPVPPPPPPPATGVLHEYVAHTTGYTAFGINATFAVFTTAAARDQWVSDTNGSLAVHLTGNRVDYTYEEDKDAKGNVGPKQNVVNIPPPKPLIFGF